MYRLFLIALLIGLSAAQDAPPPAATSPQSNPPVDQQNSAKARALIDSAVQALGGEAYLSVHDVQQEGRTYSFHLGTPNSVGVLFWRFYEFPDKERVELTKQRDVSYVYSGDAGYEVTYKGAKSVEEKDLSDYLRRREYSLDWVLRKWISSPKVAFFYEGTTVAAQKPADQVSILNERNQGVTLYLDIKTHLPLKKSFSWRDPKDKQRNIEEEVWDNYRPVQGIMTPFSTSRYYNGDISNQRFLNGVSYNRGLKESMFDVQIPSKLPSR